MLSEVLVGAVKTAIRANELGELSPYALNFAKKGNSGASFGVFQGDTNTNPLAKSVLGQVLRAAEVDEVTAGRILSLVCAPCPNGNPLSNADSDTANLALSGAGRPIVDAMDNELFQVVVARIQLLLNLTASKGWTVDPLAILSVALWTNMTGAPTLLCKWIGGLPTFGLPPPQGPVIGQADLLNYLGKTSYFQMNPHNFAHFCESVATGAKVLDQPVEV